MLNKSTWTRDQNAENQMKVSKTKSFIDKIKATFDLNLLKDFIFLNASIGCSLFYVAEINFKLTIPFFLSNIGKSYVIN